MTFEALQFFGKVYHHKFIVLKFLNVMIHDLIRRGEVHDDSKFGNDEFDEYVAATQEFQGPYGSEQNDAVREKYKALFERHAKKNSHHPEHYPDGVDGMTLMDLMEMLCDWKASSMRDNGNILNSIKICTERYKLSPQLVKILENTAKSCKM